MTFVAPYKQHSRMVENKTETTNWQQVGETESNAVSHAHPNPFVCQERTFSRTNVVQYGRTKESDYAEHMDAFTSTVAFASRGQKKKIIMSSIGEMPSCCCFYF